MTSFYRRILLVLLLPFLISGSSHKFYVSITKAEYVPEKRALQVICKIFTDDLEDVLQARYDKNLLLEMGGDQGPVDNIISQYIEMKLKILADGKKVPLKYLGKKYEMDITRIFLEATEVPAFREVEIINEVLMELFEEQENIIHFKVGDLKRSLVLKKDSPSGMLNFN